MELQQVIFDIADILWDVDSSKAVFKAFQPGIGPYGEPQLLAIIRDRLNALDRYNGSVVTKRTPDLLLKANWALEFKIVRPFGDNGKVAENWSVNLLHPYQGNVSAIGDALKLVDLAVAERKAVVVIAYEHTPPQISVVPLFQAFELLATEVARIRIGPRVEERRKGLIHPVHQQLTVVAWEILGRNV